MTPFECWEVHDGLAICHMRCTSRERAERFIEDYTAAVLKAGGHPLDLRVVHLVERAGIVAWLRERALQPSGALLADELAELP